MSVWSQPWVKSTLKALWILSLLLLIWQGYSLYHKLPERLATHFDMSGNPNGWSPKRGFFLLWYTLVLGMNALWVLLVFLIPRLLNRKLVWTISNIPNKDYWIATEERRRECARLLNIMMFGIAFLINAMLSIIYHSIIQSNIETRFRIGMWGIFASVGVMLVFTFGYLLTAFRKRTKE